ncbi:MAG: hypothetical protein OXG72_18240 [Acidobacteria bacterium]|nr:hypothetical protein [Acidobacteriota bacterium]
MARTLVLRAGAAVLGALALAACLRNPMPAAPAAGDVLAEPVEERVRPAAPRPWEWYRPAERALGGVESAGVPLPRQWRGLAVADPVRCTPFAPADYVAGGVLAPRMSATGGGFREPLACSLFGGPGDRTVRAGRVVSARVAHDAGLCARPDARAAFAADPDNRLYLPAVVAAARVEAVQRGDGEWLPGRNLCWYVGTQLRVRRRYRLSVSPWEARLFEAALRGCPAVAPAPRCDARGDRPW